MTQKWDLRDSSHQNGKKYVCTYCKPQLWAQCHWGVVGGYICKTRIIIWQLTSPGSYVPRVLPWDLLTFSGPGSPLTTGVHESQLCYQPNKWNKIVPSLQVRSRPKLPIKWKEEARRSREGRSGPRRWDPSPLGLHRLPPCLWTSLLVSPWGGRAERVGTSFANKRRGQYLMRTWRVNCFVSNRMGIFCASLGYWGGMLQLFKVNMTV